MSTLGLPYYFEDTTGLASGPTDFLDIYDRPPFLRLSTSHPRSPTKSSSPKSRSAASSSTAPAPSDLAEPRTLKIFELAARTLITMRSPYAQQHQQQPQQQQSYPHQNHRHRGDAGAAGLGAGMIGALATQTPSAVLALDGGRGIVGSVRFRGGTGMALERWLKKSSAFGSTLTRQFKASDGMYYQWSFRSIESHEWACIRLGTSDIVAHYDMRPSTELVPIYLQTSGNVLTVEESSVHLAVELLASLIVMRHIRAQSQSQSQSSY